MDTYVEIPDSVLDVGDPTRSIDWKQFNANLRNHQSRLLQLEDPSGVYSHFNLDHRYPSGTIITSAGALNTGPDTFPTPSTNAKGGYADPQFTLYVDNGSWTEQIATSSTADNHFLRGTGGCAIEAVPAVFFNGRTKPIGFRVRLRLSANPTTGAQMFIGMFAGGMITARPSNGIYLECKDSDELRFVSSRAGSNTVGTNTFAPPTVNTWWEVEISFEDASGNQALCYTRDAAGAATLVETFTTDLPTDRMIFGCVAMSHTANKDVDRFSLVVPGALSDAA